MLALLLNGGLAINFYRLLRGYVKLPTQLGPTVYYGDLGGPAAYFGDLSRWDNITHDALNAVMTWIGDSLAIYRCYLVWSNDVRVVVVPILLLIMSIISNSIALHTFARLQFGTIFSKLLVRWMSTIYALSFVQNTMTASLIAYRLWEAGRQSRKFSAAVLPLDSKRESNLYSVMRIVVESALVYALEVLVLIVLYALKLDGQYVIQEAIVPTVGIVFTLITVRLAMQSSSNLKTTMPGGTVNHSLRFASGETTISQDTRLHSHLSLETRYRDGRQWASFVGIKSRHCYLTERGREDEKVELVNNLSP